MDILGRVVRDYLKQVHADSVRSASALAMELRAEGMVKDQVKEMLYASGFESEVIRDVLSEIFPGGKQK